MPVISSLSLSSTTLALNGPSVGYTATISDPELQYRNLSTFGQLIQGTLKRDFTQKAVPCGIGQTTCTVSGTIAASSLSPGSATFRLNLLDEFGTVLHTKSVAVTLVRAASIVGLSLGSTAMTIEGPTLPSTVTLQNVGPSLSGMVVQGWINQGTTRRAAGGSAVTCGSGVGVLPNGTCTMSFDNFNATNSAGGSGTLVPGAATLEVELHTQDGTVWATKSVAVTLVSATTISDLSLSSTTAIIGGPKVPGTATIQNVGPTTVSSRWIQAWINQGTTRRAANGTVVSQNGLPTGTYVISISYSASNSGFGTGTLVPGTATLEVDLLDGNDVVHDKRFVQVTLINP